MNGKGRLNRSFSHSTISRPALVLDLDETLIHSTHTPPPNGTYFQIRVRRRHVFIHMRPGLIDFLTQIQRIYDLFFFSASLPEYANAIITKIAPEVRLCRRFFRDSCQTFSGYLVKDLSVLRRPLSQTLLVDDIAGSALANQANLILVKAWMGDTTDQVLLDSLLPLLKQILFYSDLAKAAREILMKGNRLGLTGFPIPSIKYHDKMDKN
jgi:Dullard-like phosphatase family protein